MEITPLRASGGAQEALPEAGRANAVHIVGMRSWPGPVDGPYGQPLGGLVVGIASELEEGERSTESEDS